MDAAFGDAWLSVAFRRAGIGGTYDNVVCGTHDFAIA
jgi:hypothetical protein